MFFASLSPPCPHDRAAFGLWRFRKKETSSFSSWIWWFLPTFSVSADIDVHPCSVVKRPKAHSYLKASNLHTSVESSIGLTMTVQVSALANAFWNGEQEGRHDSQSQGAHTWVSLGQVIGASMGERSAGPFQFKVQTRHFYCENYTENLLKLFFQFTLFSIHAIGIAWNAILLKVSNVSVFRWRRQGLSRCYNTRISNFGRNISWSSRESLPIT